MAGQGGPDEETWNKMTVGEKRAYWISIAEPQTRELHVSAFKWHGKPYPAVSLRDLLAPEYERLMKSVIQVAHELNACLRAAV